MNPNKIGIAVVDAQNESEFLMVSIGKDSDKKVEKIQKFEVNSAKKLYLWIYSEFGH